MEKGWNIATLPRNSESVVTNCESDPYVFFFYPDTQQYSAAKTIKGIFANSEDISYGIKTSFWTYTPKSCQLSVTVSSDPLTITEQGTLEKAWNFIPGKSVGTCKVLGAYGFDAKNQDWIIIDTSTTAPANVMGLIVYRSTKKEACEFIVSR